MTISLKTMLKNVASENYDKTNIFLYILIAFLTAVLSGIIIKPTDSPYQMMVSFLVFLIPLMIITIWTSGIIAVASHNAIKRKKGVYPQPFKEIGRLFLQGIIFNVGLSINTTIITLVTAIIMIPLIFIKEWLSILAAIPCLFLTFILLGLHFNYLTTLRIEEWFDYPKAIKFMKAGRGYFSPFFFKSLALLIIYLIVMIIILAIAVLILCGMTIATNGNNSLETITAAQTLGAIIGSVPTGIFMVYLTELTAQFIRSVLKKQGKLKE